MMNLIDAAAYIGFRPRTLRKIIDRSRLRLQGVPVSGQTIQFFQTTRRGAILFRRAWLDAFIDAGTKRPESAPLLTKTLRPKPPPTRAAVIGAVCEAFGPLLDR